MFYDNFFVTECLQIICIFALMNRIVQLLLIFSLTLFSLQINAQEDSLGLKVIQFSGVVVAGDSLSPVPLTTVYRSRDQRGTFTDYYGFFSIPAYVGDTITFSNVGYTKSTFVIPFDLTQSRYSIVQMMSSDTINIPEVFIYPWPTREEFREDFLALELPNSEAEIARANLDRIILQDKMYQMSMDGSENYRLAMKQHTDKLYYAGQAPPNKLLDPFAWAAFIKALRDGSLKQ